MLQKEWKMVAATVSLSALTVLGAFNGSAVMTTLLAITAVSCSLYTGLKIASLRFPEPSRLSSAMPPKPENGPD